MPVALRTTSGASIMAIVAAVDQRSIQATVSSTPRVQPASSDTSRRLDGDDAGLVGRDAGAAEAPRQVDAEDAHGQSRAYWATTSAAPSSARSASSSPVGGTPITQRVKPISA